ncbi:hypothetical protein [Croceitalea rosinachiae]|uniref:Heavy-metal resistance n=1 Tax=Croceitalea rosinachiae TaxID=3075596 RepID=A0ABU3A5L0_9FLAO|nr:hypothetical protein [Croceitalea sp. F388]MDT0605449.1 hypothetical protein [Croceitalea sp. F388]
MKKNLLLTILLIFLMVMNGVLLYLVLNKTERKNRPPKVFITQQLGFNDNQLADFRSIDEEHHRKMRALEDNSRDLKELLFSNLDNTNFTTNELDSITNLIGQLSIDKEQEVFNYFKALENICTDKQKIKLKNIVTGALRRNPQRGDPPPPR